MFAILLSKEMEPFYQNISSFPTAVFSLLFIICLLYWLVALLGFIDLDFINLDHLTHHTPDIDINPDLSSSDALAGLMMRYGLYGVPLIVIISLITVFGWFFCYLIVHYLFGFIPDGIFRYLAGIPVLLITFFIGVLITGQIIKPLRPFFSKLEQHTVKKIVGRMAKVRTSRVDNQFGEAILDDGGAGLILKVRTIGDEVINKGENVIILEYLEEKNVYRVMSEKEFNQ